MKASFLAVRAQMVAAMGLGAFTACSSSMSDGQDHGVADGAADARAQIQRPRVGECSDAGATSTATDSGVWDSGQSPDATDGAVSSPCAGGCTSKPYGECATYTPFYPSPPFSQCEYGCMSNADCGAGSVCVCGSPYGRCALAECHDDADCSGGALCLLTSWPNPCGLPSTLSFECVTPGTECQTARDCTGGFNAYCEYGNCRGGAVCGRPFIVEGIDRRAAAVERNDWSACAELRDADLSDDVRKALVEHFTDAALMEHASVAAFARFVLQLLSLGAPPTLVTAAQAALADEITHARLCFGLASHYGKRAIGPGSLPMDGALGASSLREIVVTAFIEGCIGETCAAMEAAEAASSATEPAVAEILRGIAEDERRHAELAYRFLRWAVDRMGAHERALTLRELHRVVRDHTQAEAPAIDPDLSVDLLEYGVLSASHRGEIRASVLRHVVAPCLGMLEAAGAVPDEATLGCA